MIAAVNNGDKDQNGIDNSDNDCDQAMVLILDIELALDIFWLSFSLSRCMFIIVIVDRICPFFLLV